MKEMFGGAYADVGARDVLLGAVDGAPAVVGASLAAKGARLVGLGGHALITREGTTLWAQVSSITATDPVTNESVELTGRLTEQPGGAATETIGPARAGGYDRSLALTQRQIELIGRILRERSSSERLGFR